MKVLWCMVAEISSMADRTFWLFGLFCPILPPNNPKSQNFEKMKKIPGDISILHKCTINDNYMIYGFWDMKCNRYVILSFGPFFFCPLTKAWKMKISKQMKKTPGDIIILHKCTKNHDHMLYCSWDMAHDRCNCYFSFSTKIKISKKLTKTPGDIIILYNCSKIMIICYTFPEIWHVTDLFIFHFGLFSALLHPPAPSP